MDIDSRGQREGRRGSRNLTALLAAGLFCVLAPPALAQDQDQVAFRLNLGLGPSLDATTLAVDDVQTGVGVLAEITIRPGIKGLQVGPVAQICGVETGEDAIVFTSLEARYRRPFGRAGSVRPYWELGSGLGLVWLYHVEALGIPLQAELGIEASLGGAVVSVGVRERFVGMIGDGRPPVDMMNSVQLVVGIGFRSARGK